MKVNMKCFAGLSKRYECDYRKTNELDVPESGSVNDAVRSLGIRDDEVKLVFVNGRLTGRSKPLSDGDQVTLVPATGGM
jgi:sulfur carrier protein ThiS